MPKKIRWEPPVDLFTLANVAPLGVTRSALRVAEESGHVVRVAHGVYIAASAVPDDAVLAHVQRAMAHQMLRPNAIASHNTAALAWGLDLPDPRAAAAGPVEFTVPHDAQARSLARPGLAVAVRRLPPQHRTSHPSGLLVTTHARTAVDVAARLPLPEALIVLDCAAREILTRQVGDSRRRASYTRPAVLADALEPLREAAQDAATPQTRRRLAAGLELVDPRRESALESYSFGKIAEAGLPLPQLQVCIPTPEGNVYPDFLWPTGMVIGEADGREKYKTEKDTYAEKCRQELLESIGYRFVRWGYGQMWGRPAEVLGRMTRVLIARGVL